MNTHSTRDERKLWILVAEWVQVNPSLGDKLKTHQYTALCIGLFPHQGVKGTGSVGVLPRIPSQDSAGHCEMKMWILHSAFRGKKNVSLVCGRQS